MAYARPVSGDIPQLELADDHGDTARIAHGRGGLVTSLRRDGRELLYLDRATLLDQNANVRGGIPLLFPSPGKLAGDRWERDDRAGTMKQHGFARSMPFEVVALGGEGGAGATAMLRLRADATTLAVYPWRFALECTFSLANGALRIDLRVANESETSMPFGVGMHPYFFVPDGEKSGARIPSPATRVFDNVTKETRAFDGLELRAKELDAHLLDHGSSSASLERDEAAASIAVRGSPEFTRWVVWTLAGKDFVCLEPWTCPGNALNTGEGLLWLEPGTSRTLSVSFDRTEGA